eukprot:30723-Pelagococcus_subviridis.AAC.17
MAIVASRSLVARMCIVARAFCMAGSSASSFGVGKSPCPTVSAAGAAAAAAAADVVAFTPEATVGASAAAAVALASADGSTHPFGRPTFIFRPHSSMPSRCCAASLSAIVRSSTNANLLSGDMFTPSTAGPSGESDANALLNTSESI